MLTYDWTKNGGGQVIKGQGSHASQVAIARTTAHSFVQFSLNRNRALARHRF